MRKNLVRLTITALLSTALFAGCTALHEKQGEWIFSPTDRTWGNTAEMAAGMDEAWVTFDSKETGKPTKLHLLINGNDPAKPVLLYLHGARWNVVGSAWRIERMRDLGFNVVAVDYRGFGKSEAEPPSEDKAYEDAQAAWNWIAQKYPNQPRLIFGHSLGGAIAIDLASKVSDERGTIVEGTFTSIPDVFNTLKWGWLPLGWLISQRFDSEKKVAKIGSPILVVHGSEDRVIAPALGQRLYEAAASPKRFELVQGGSHHNTNSIGRTQYREAIKALFSLELKPS
ncbi:alpha/beta fold hydrolase [Variovorax sp. PCZ-1]|uniref:alpha/beta hydrolase n=1 Tax=Variovorax sp. PCZ-1 TaxID=2835533 RepID=UPI001BCAD83A|nr:alpha/beta fold hydrolase [Variovorax sp. PCZ-1]MBS7808170.1 alpha/beta fold hydrolase [Variovorax sp. PCZ-1]